MPHLRIAIGYRTEHRSAEQAVVLGIGTDKAALQAAIDAAPADLLRFEFGVFTPTGKATRNSTPCTPPAPAADETHDKTAAGALPSEPPSAPEVAEGGDDDGGGEAPTVVRGKHRR
ncbi:MAG: hypothetical protein ABMA13_23980 [Chthoniobacteraceae bacterium]